MAFTKVRTRKLDSSLDLIEQDDLGCFTATTITLISGSLTIDGDLGLGGGLTIGTLTISSGGDLRLNDSGTCWDDLRVPVSSLKVPAANNPDWVSYGAGRLLGFGAQAVSGNEEMVFFTAQMPHNMKLDGEIEAHVHWLYTAAEPTKAVRWHLLYNWVNAGQEINTTGTAYVLASTGDPDTHIYTDLGELSRSNAPTLSSMLICRLTRNSSNVDDTYSADAILMEIDFHYEVDGFGSEEELVKI